jgi:hypothetical protein
MINNPGSTEWLNTEKSMSVLRLIFERQFFKVEIVLTSSRAFWLNEIDSSTTCSTTTELKVLRVNTKQHSR